MFDDNPILQLLRESLYNTTLTERITITLAIGPILALFIYELNRLSIRIPQFEGPFGLPVVGNIWQLGKDAPEQYRQWAKKYGGVYQVQLGSIPVLVVNTAAAAKEIFGKNSSAVTSRPEFYTFHKIVSDTSGTTIGTSPYTESLKKRRKATASALNKPAVQSYVPHLDEETRVFIAELWNKGKGGKTSVNPIPMIQRLNLSLGLTMNWGTRMERHDDSLLQEVTYVEDEISKMRSTNQNIQDYIPPLRLNPFGLQSERAKEMRTRRDKYIDKLDSDLAKRMADGTQKPCIQANILNDEEATLTKREISSVNVTMIAAGLDTMISAVSWGFACLADRPHIQEAALKAIREQCPADQPLCDADDDQQCQYLNNFIKEVLRFYTMARLSLPRRSVKDFVYEEKVVPAGTILFLNAWACNMDEEYWQDPEEFRPERWDTPDLQHFTLGLGYRMCVGYQLAYRELYLVFLRTLNSFEIQKHGPVDSDPLRGVDDPTVVTIQPKPFKVKFVPRNSQALKEALHSELERS